MILMLSEAFEPSSLRGKGSRFLLFDVLHLGVVGQRSEAVPLEIVRCPVCRQKLGIQEYVIVGTEVVCANMNCLSSMRIVRRRPLQVELITEAETYNVNDRPESYG